jgi:hypothetical protein
MQRFIRRSEFLVQFRPKTMADFVTVAANRVKCHPNPMSDAEVLRMDDRMS